MAEVRLINAIPLEKEMREYARYIGLETTNECESTAECCADMVSEAPAIDPESLRGHAKQMKPKTKSELMAEWASQPGQLKKEREVKAVRKAMDDARAVMQDGLTRYVKKKTKARSMAKAEADPFAELEGWESMEQIQDAYGYGEITADRRDKLADLWEAREAARNSRKGADKYHDLVTEMLETAIRRVGNEYADMLFEHDQQRREAEKQCEQLAMEGMMKK
jgi:hypothetical protein